MVTSSVASAESASSEGQAMDIRKAKEVHIARSHMLTRLHRFDPCVREEVSYLHVRPHTIKEAFTEMRASSSEHTQLRNNTDMETNRKHENFIDPRTNPKNRLQLQEGVGIPIMRLGSVFIAYQ